jgi:hypothetical protein
MYVLLRGSIFWSLAFLLLSCAPPPPSQHYDFALGRLRYGPRERTPGSGEAEWREGGVANLLKKASEESKFSINPNPAVLWGDEDEIDEYLLLYIGGPGDVELTEKARKNLKGYLERGGTLLADSWDGAKGVGFDRSIREHLRMMFPEDELHPVSANHPVFKSHFEIEEVLGGSKRIDPYLEGLEIEGRTAVFYSINDLISAWEGHPCRPGGEAQRRHSFEMGINLIHYAFSGK